MQADDDTILRTKLHRPRLPADFVSRTRLLDLIGLNCAHPVVIVSAPAGYGKSLLVKEPGPDVLRLRVAITDLVPNKPEASVATLVIPFSWIPDAGSGVAKGEAGSTVSPDKPPLK